MLQITAEEKKALKGRGLILSRNGETFVARTITEDGTLTSEQLEALAEAARRFGNGKVALTIRLTVEIQGISYENLEPMSQFLEPYGLYTGGTGAKIRPIVACKGSVCTHGIIDTQGLARELHQRFYLGWHDVALPHKFKIAVGGCPNNCVKPSINDFGIMGQRKPHYDPEKCRGCKKCNVAASCPMKICTKGEDGKMTRRQELCTNCGKCIAACPFHAVEESAVGYKIFIGGIWGKHQRMATPLDDIFTKDEVIRLLEKTLNLWREQGNAGERFGLFLDRIGVENFVAQLKQE